MLAVIKTGGKQYIVKPNDIISIERIDGDIDDAVVFDEVILFSSDDKDADIGAPYIKGVSVEGKIVDQGREKKKIVFKYKPKTRYKVKKGHRQEYTKVLIVKINSK